LAVNAGFMVGHSAIRRAVMGEAASERAASEDELASMMAVLRDALSAGGLGFSSSWAASHSDALGVPVPSRHALRAELLSLAAVVGESEGTSLEFIPPLAAPEDPFEPDAIKMMADMSAAAGRPLNWNLLRPTAANGGAVTAKLRAYEEAQARGGKVVALTLPFAPLLRLDFSSGFVFDTFAGWDEPMARPLVEKLRMLRDPAERRRLAEWASRPGPLRRFADWPAYTIAETFSRETKAAEGRLVADIAAEHGKAAFDALLDIVCADELKTKLMPHVEPRKAADWEANVAVWRSGRAVIGGSDAGAHVDMVAGFNYATELIREAVHDHAVLPLEEMVHLLTEVPAALYGLRDRGSLRPGAMADAVVFDEDTIGSATLRTAFDLPGGAGRLYADATGVHHVIVNGGLIVDSGKLTGEQPGTVIRSGHDTTGPAMT
jgi:N-acyl-D-aspartate/D-glutamate deacylase